LELTYKSGVRKRIICKRGDDLRQDYYIQTLFKLFNEIWECYSQKHSNCKLPYLYTYSCIPLYSKFGVIEYVENSVPVSDFDWENIKSLNNEEKEIFIRTLAGSALASYILGIRDRHEDNMLIKDNHIFFHIDFGHLWNNRPLVDAPRISIPNGIKNIALTESEWNYLLKLFIDGYSVLYLNSSTVINVTSTLFQDIKNPQYVNKFLKSENSLMVDIDLETAKERMAQIFTQSFESISKTLKNFAHKLSGNSPKRTPRQKKVYRAKTAKQYLNPDDERPTRPRKQSQEILLLNTLMIQDDSISDSRNQVQEWTSPMSLSVSISLEQTREDFFVASLTIANAPNNPLMIN